MSIYLNVCINLWKYGGDTTIRTWMVVNYVLKFQKNRKKQMVLHNLQSHLVCRYVKMCALIWHTFLKSLKSFLFFRLKFEFLWKLVIYFLIVGIFFWPYVFGFLWLRLSVPSPYLCLGTFFLNRKNIRNIGLL